MKGGEVVSFQSIQTWLNQNYVRTYIGNTGIMYADAQASMGIGYVVITQYVYSLSKNNISRNNNNFDNYFTELNAVEFVTELKM